MAIVLIPKLLRDLSGGQTQVSVEGDTPRQVFNHLAAAFPEMKARLVESGFRKCSKPILSVELTQRDGRIRTSIP